MKSGNWEYRIEEFNESLCEWSCQKTESHPLGAERVANQLRRYLKDKVIRIVGVWIKDPE